MPTLRHLAARTDHVVIACDRCNRHGRYIAARLLQRYGDITMFDLFDLLAADCPRRKADQHLYDLCGIRCPTLLEIE